MKIENQVTSLELSKQLKEVGVPQESLFYRDKTGNIFPEYNWTDVQETDPEGYGIIKENWYSAFIVAELGEMLPYAIQIPRKGSLWLELVKNGERPGIGRKWEAMYTGVEDQQGESECLPWPVCSAETEAEARGLLLLYLKKQGLI